MMRLVRLIRAIGTGRSLDGENPAHRVLSIFFDFFLGEDTAPDRATINSSRTASVSGVSRVFSSIFRIAIFVQRTVGHHQFLFDGKCSGLVHVVKQGGVDPVGSRP
jgi:hypothetical protein